MRHTPSLLIVIASVLVFAPFALAQDVPAAPSANGVGSGPVTLTYTKGAAYTGTHARISGDVHLDSANFGMQAETVLADLRPGAKGKGAVGLARAVLEPAAGGQVSGHFTDIAQGRSYHFQADRAVYVPDSSRAGGGRVDLTGHVQIAVSAPVALDGPLLTRTDHAVVLLGPGPSYPQVETGAGRITFTPLNGGQ